MGRPKRHYRAGGIYHVINRGHNQSFIFDNRQDKSCFLEIIRNVQKEQPFKIIYYVLMSNHYHFILEMRDIPLNFIIQRINQAYGKYLNAKYGRNGTSFGTRLKVYAITDEPYFLQLIHYIGNNPVRAGIVNHPDSYPWSAHQELLRGGSGLVDSISLFRLIGETEKAGRNRYWDLIENHNDSVSKAKNTEKFIREQRIYALERLLEQYIIVPNQSENNKTKRWNMTTICVKKSFITAASTNGFKSAEIAQVLQMSVSAIRQCMALTGDCVPGTKSPESKPDNKTIVDNCLNVPTDTVLTKSKLSPGGSSR